MFTIVNERPSDGPTIENLYEAAFGPGRFARTAERLREGNQPIPSLCFIAEEDGALAGSVRFWPIQAGETFGLMLGPLAVQPHRRRNGMGVQLINSALARAKAMGVPFVILVGDEPYYSRVGFKVAEAGRFQLPGPVEANRLLVLELDEEGKAAAGDISAAPSAAFTPPCAKDCAA